MIYLKIFLRNNMEIVLLILLMLSAFLNVNFLVKQEKFEELLLTRDDELDLLILHYSNVLQKMKEIDSKGIFESDDEVGTTFKMLESAIEEGKEYLRKYTKDDSRTDS